MAVLTKADVAEDVAGAVEVAERLIGGGDVVASARSPGWYGKMSAFLEPGSTIALLGPSGAGKSTLANRLGLGAVDFGPARSAMMVRVGTRRLPGSSSGSQEARSYRHPGAACARTVGRGRGDR